MVADSLPFNAASVIAAEGARLSATARASGLDAPIAHLPRWRVGDLVAHTAGVHRWATRVITERSMDVPGIEKAPLDGDGLLDHFDEGIPLLLAALAATEPDALVPNFHPGTPSTIRFWWRRQAHETTVHRWDAEAAAPDATHVPMDDALALDGIDELLTGFATRGSGHGLERAVTIASGGRAWRMAPSADKPGRLTAERLAATPDDADIAGPPADVVLALWKRLPSDHPTLHVVGVDAAAFLAGPLTP